MTEQTFLNLLNELNIPFVRVEHPPLAAIEDYYYHNIELPDQGIKNLFLRNRKGNRFYLVIMDEHKQADLDKVAEQIGETRLSFGSAEKLSSFLGVPAGCVTPYALPNDSEQKITVLLDDAIKQDELLGFHPLVNHATVCINYENFMRFLSYTGHTPKLITL